MIGIGGKYTGGMIPSSGEKHQSMSLNTDPSTKTKQMAFLIFSQGNQVNCWNAPNCKDGLQDAGLQGPFMIQGEMSSEVDLTGDSGSQVSDWPCG